MMLRFGRVYLRFRKTAKKGARVFEDELRRQGLDDEIAARLTSVYLEGSDIHQVIRTFR
jgi:hypothetical protein